MLINEKTEQAEMAPVHPPKPAYTATQNEAKSRWRWYHWLITKPFDWISTPFYVGATLSLVYTRSAPAIFNPQFEWWQILVALAATLILLGLDRYEYYRWGEEVRFQVAIFNFC
jgi:hypothetical protein